ncbi:MAG: SOS response-associated peptidase [Chloroflexota bacterium]|nr:SOS response-associated peptidase [Chloroflexota bacterium]
MSCRFGLLAELDALAEQFNFDPSIMQDIYSPRWNVPPKVPVLTVQSSSSEDQPGENTARLLHWGMTGARHPRSRGSSRPLFNTRAETVHRLLSFRQPFRERCCLIPASGFYEWGRDESGRIWFHREYGAPVAFAGIWSTERADDGDIDTCVVITCAANDLVAPLYHRMPVILQPEMYRGWLDPDADAEDLLVLVQPSEWPEVAHHAVSKEVNRAANDYPALVEHAVREMQLDLTAGSGS